MMQPSISVIVPTYDRAGYLPATLQSVFEQTIAVDQVLLVDDGSTDDTRDVIEMCLARHPTWQEKLHYLHQENRGKSAAINAALPLIRGEYVAFNDSDDRWLPSKLQLQLEALRRFPECSVCFTETSLLEFNELQPEYDNGMGAVGKVERPSCLFGTQWPGIYMQTVLVRTDTLKQFGEFDSQFRVSQDVDFLFRLGLLTPFCYVNAPLVEIDRAPGRAVGLITSFPSTSVTSLLEREARLQKWLNMPSVNDSALRRALKRDLASSQSALANRHIASGDVDAARVVLRRGLQARPEFRLLTKLLMSYFAPQRLERLATNRMRAESSADSRRVDSRQQPRNAATKS